MSKISPTQRRILAAANPGPLRTDWDGWTFGEQAAIRALIRKGLAKEVCWRLSATDEGRLALETVEVEVYVPRIDVPLTLREFDAYLNNTEVLWPSMTLSEVFEVYP